ncbi:hypothetical protein LPB72_07310 [Hydrogenophaga crassostreae]|uniref:Uncharacterized protein n=1 Tax=Hydrogenophaga crassostreae TaxID=1763535 RepID=A0ABX2U9U3_9BURK|nr:hypothetical protein [Hydrogenophaga crassostreae]OAD42709.1 hypothetical protein LPB72_07310 [Hydrogenophaga crassostreae]
MSESAEGIQAFLNARKADYVTAVRVVRETNTAILDVSREKVGKTASRGMTSKRQLAHLSSMITKELGLSVVIALRSGRVLTDIEAGLRATLERRHPNEISELVVSFPTTDRAEVLLRTTENVDVARASAVRTAVEEFLRDANFSEVRIEVLESDLPMPNLMVILKTLKVCAPANLDQLSLFLRKSGFQCPDVRWLSAKLDIARKRDWVVRFSTGLYGLTTKGLTAVPVSRRRNSSDIDRILALGRRRTW